jgi:dipeptidyl aminopeptidase/acylaminoacyl peptidase
MVKWLMAACAVLISVSPLNAQERQLAPLPVEAAIAAHTFSTTPFSLSNDGQWIAYTLNDPKRSQLISDERQKYLTRSGAPPAQIGCDVWITNTRTRETRNLTQGKGNNWAPSWSPDGNSLAFFSDRAGLASLWLWEESSGRLRQVSDLPVTGYRGLAVPRWTPDGKNILFCVLPGGMTVEKAALLTIGLEQNRPEANLDKPDQPTVTVFKSAARKGDEATENKPRSFSAIYSDGYIADLAIVEIASSRVRRLVRNSKPCGYWPSPDGMHVAFTNLKNDAGRMRFDLIAVSLSDSVPTVLATNLQQGYVAFSVSWSPDGTLLSYTTAESQPGSQPRRECYLVSLDGKQKRKVTGAPAIGFSNPLRAALWDKTGKSLYLTSTNSVWRVSTADVSALEVARLRNRSTIDIVPSTIAGRFWSPDDDRSLFVITSDRETMRVGLSKIDLATGAATTVVEEDKVYGSGNDLIPAAMGSINGPTLIYIAEDVSHSPDFWGFDERLQSPRRVTTINQEFEKYVMGTSSLVEWTGPNGERLRGALLLPAGYQKGKRYPMVVSIYPNEEFSRYVNLFGLKLNFAPESVNNRQLLATRGYVVLLADSFTTIGNPMQDIVRTVIPGINKLIEMGIADPERLGIIGHSHGAYAVLGMITQVQRFRAAVCWSGSANLITMYGQLDADGTSHWINWAEKGDGSVGGSLWEFRERYIENSPVFYLDRVTTPVLIVQGSSDRITTPARTEEIFVGLRRLGKEVEYARYEGEDHGFWFYPNRVDFSKRVIRWFDQWLKPAAADLSGRSN